ncbi:RNA polymerase, sigma 28 subunit, SigI [Pseudobacteroides cellulosolvens ATCC 35603 = DSM 2933]|uniref:RNA polymerase sigma factor SigI n=1 Tax=Pseudobacteroides cellulosolvens ATCC 35603 = DSM 2933 TaxID=398512 RepID=A0A0L6JX74_9FIRM|nr:RNA polymerase, sigma 28 subunit, SigI [Pseudobacteroides cellulosolvens ATCC 35603 = DSM 2933]
MVLWSKKEKKDASKKNEDISQIIERIKSGDNKLRERFIEDYRPFIIGCVSKQMNKFIDIENSEEFSIGLMAFDEAISSYNIMKGQHFLSFAELVISRRLINHRKKEVKNSKVIPFSYFGGESELVIENSISQKSVYLHYDRYEMREEILIYNQKLELFGITMDDLVKKSPKHKDSKELMIGIAKIIADNEFLYNKLISKKTVPMSDLIAYITVNPKTVEKNRKYIIAVCLALKSELEIIKGFIKKF